MTPINETGPKGRGASSNAVSRFEPYTRQGEDDGWYLDDEDLPKFSTSISSDKARKVISRNDSPDIPFSQSLNAFRGCEHGCIYCFARPTHAYLGLSPGLDFETKLSAKFDAPELLERELRAKSYKCEVLAMGTNTDPYQPIERKLKITRRVLEVLSSFNNPTSIVTKSALIIRDIDILQGMAERRLVRVYLSVTTLDRQLARAMEPRAATPDLRLRAIRSLAAAGIPVGVMVAPIIPALNDAEIEQILEAARDAGASSASYVLLRLPLEIKELFSEWLEKHYPARAKHVLNLVRQTRGGRLNDPNFGSRFVGSGAYSELLSNRFELSKRRLGLSDRKWTYNFSLFKTPIVPGPQLDLFGGRAQRL